MNILFWRGCAKIVGLVLALVLCYSPAVTAQTDNMVHVKSFPGGDVGTKTANAMATCSSSTSIACVLVIDPSLSAFPAGTQPSLCGHCYLWDWRSGPPASSGGYAGVLSDGASGLKVGGVMNQFQGYGAVFAGDSRTAIAGDGLPTGDEWPEQLQAMPAGAGMVSWNNVAISGSQCADWVNSYYATYVHPLRPSAVGHPQLFFLWCGVNDLSSGGKTGAATVTALQTLWSEAHTDGFTVIAFDECQGGTYGINSPNFTALREGIASSVNYYDYLFDVFLNFPDTTDGTYWNTTESPVFHMNAVGAHQLAFQVNKLLVSRNTWTPVQTTVTPALNWVYWNQPLVKMGLEGIYSAYEVGLEDYTSTAPVWSVYWYHQDSTHYQRLRESSSGTSVSIEEESLGETALPLIVDASGASLYLFGSTVISSATILPNTDASEDLGSHAERFRNGYFSQGAGTATLASGTASVTFSTAFGATPICTCTDQTGVNAVQCMPTSTTHLTINGTGSDVIAYHCFGN